MLLINCEINLILTLSEHSLISSETKVTKSKIRDTKLYVTVKFYQFKTMQNY